MKKPFKSAKDERELQLEYAIDYGINLKERVVLLTGEIDEQMFMTIETALTQLESENRSGITIRINSGGGSVYDALAIVGRIRKSTCKITIEGYGCVMSAATIILACGDKRLISRYAWFMTHESSYDSGTERHSAHKAMVIQREREEKEWARHIAEFTSKEEDFWFKTGQRMDAYFTAEELVELGVADKVI